MFQMYDIWKNMLICLLPFFSRNKQFTTKGQQVKCCLVGGRFIIMSVCSLSQHDGLALFQLFFSYQVILFKF